jgi:hypothetical protein
LITLDKRNHKATLRFRARKKYEFFVRGPANDQCAVEVPDRTLEEVYIEQFLISHIANTPMFIVSLIADYNPKYLFPMELVF